MQISHLRQRNLRKHSSLTATSLRRNATRRFKPGKTPVLSINMLEAGAKEGLRQIKLWVPQTFKYMGEHWISTLRHFCAEQPCYRQFLGLTLAKFLPGSHSHEEQIAAVSEALDFIKAHGFVVWPKGLHKSLASVVAEGKISTSGQFDFPREGCFTAKATGYPHRLRMYSADLNAWLDFLQAIGQGNVIFLPPSVLVRPVASAGELPRAES